MGKKRKIVKEKDRRLWVRNDVYEAIDQLARKQGKTVDQWVEEAPRDETKKEASK